MPQPLRRKSLGFGAASRLTSNEYAQERRAAVRNTWGKGWTADKEVIFSFYLHEDERSDSEKLLVHEERREHDDIVVIRNDDVGVALSTGQAGVTQRVGDLPQDLNILPKSTECCLVPH